MLNKGATRQAGVTLVELIVAIVIMGIAVAGLVTAFRSTARSSVDPVITRQMAAVAETMMEEVLLKPFAEANNAAGRANFNDIFDYGGPGRPAFAMAGITDINGVAIEGLGRYGLTVVVQRAAIRDVAQNDGALITVTVSYPGFDNLVLRAWRTRAQ